jgi:hypothetical protein
MDSTVNVFENVNESGYLDEKFSVHRKQEVADIIS